MQLCSGAFTRYSFGSAAQVGSFVANGTNTRYVLPAQSFEQNVVTFRAVFDAPQQTHGSVSPQVLVELHGVEIFHGDPSEDRPRLFYI